jgi:uracil phosphoribosyltransferase
MLEDSQYLKRGSYMCSEIEHKYGDNVHILNHPFLFTLLAQLSEPQCKHPTFQQVITLIYRELIGVVSSKEFPIKTRTVESRMKAFHPEGAFSAPTIDTETRAVCVNLARAGAVPSQICFETLNYLLNPDLVRQDHISINRKIDDHEKVIGTQLGGVKIGGDIAQSYVLFPDPMGATGSTLKSSLEIYKKLGKAKKYIAIHLVVTPEYLHAMRSESENLTIYAVRLDRGLSPASVLNSVPGTHWSQERGLNEKHYIVPGAGGLGELLNNSYV